MLKNNKKNKAKELIGKTIEIRSVDLNVRKLFKVESVGNVHYNGSYGDDGAGIIEGHASLKKYEQQIDPEWETYLRLQEKFANKY